MSQEKAFFLLKFGEKENLESLQQGNLYMKNLKFFVDLEKMKQKKGMGDASEGSLVINNVKWEMKDFDTGETVLKLDAAKASLRNDSILSLPVFCAMSIGLEDLEQVGEEINNTVETRIVFTDQQKEEMLNEFGEYALVIPAQLFIERVKEAFKNEGHSYASGSVDYLDYSINYQSRFLEFENGDPKLLFNKDIAFEYQKEFRVVILNKEIEDFLITNIGDLTEHTALVKSSDLLKGNYGVKLTLKEQ